jgi:hypothetical protein
LNTIYCGAQNTSIQVSIFYFVEISVPLTLSSGATFPNQEQHLLSNLPLIYPSEHIVSLTLRVLMALALLERTASPWPTVARYSPSSVIITIYSLTMGTFTP